MSREVDAREKELIHQVHRDILIKCLESVKSLAPILICSMKIFVQILNQGKLIFTNLLYWVIFYYINLIYKVVKIYDCT